MRVLRKGAARNALAQNLAELMGTGAALPYSPDGMDIRITAAVLGGAIKETCRQQGIDVELFFRYLNHNTFDLTRTLKASNLLDKVE